MTTEQGPGSNRPLATAIVMLIGALTGVPIVIAAVMAYLFKAEAPAGSWELTHYSYHIRTFWVSLLLAVVGVIGIVLLIGIFLLALLPIWVIIRSIVPLVKAANREPMPNPTTWLF
ncbi:MULTISPECIES: DUF4870 family protein [Pacificimonas]|uniref:Transmembrane protein n=1 Tax=Pacificimonas aurantium TaxID=1250540 RepID=A0ABS7WI03_9SPHN|nr:MULTISPECIES: hypothetical protein [Pacificimonas]MBZ6377605.1 hypothetical protein [Pacificimonas aurantium]